MTPLDGALAAAGWIDLAATATLGGGLIYGAVVAARAARGTRALRGAAVALVVALVLEFALTAVRMAEVSGIRGPALVTDLLATRWGRLWMLRLAGMAALALPGALGAALVPPWLLLRSFQGHAGAHGTVPALVDWLHLTAATAWLGCLVQLVLVPGPLAVGAARRTRTLATIALAVLVPAGVYGALLHVERVDVLVASPYGRALLVKLALAAPLLALGAVNHFRHVPAMSRGDAAAPALLARTVRIEVAVAAAVLLATALLGILPMPHVHAS